jgi:hypothetical protein
MMLESDQRDLLASMRNELDGHISGLISSSPRIKSPSESVKELEKRIC